jgi:hypothetical protein
MVGVIDGNKRMVGVLRMSKCTSQSVQASNKDSKRHFRWNWNRAKFEDGERKITKSECR